MGKILVTISLLTLSFGYLLYTPLPPDFINPWRGRAITLFCDTMETLARGASMVTGKEMSFYVNQLATPMFHLVHEDFPELETKTMQMNGVKTRLYRRKSLTGSIPAVVYFHGGGWVMGDIDGIDGLGVKLALATNMTFIAVNYRKAPVHPYPTPFHDSLKATQYVLKNAQDLEIDSTRVFLAERMIMFWTAYLGIPFTKQTLNAIVNDRHISTDLQKSRFGSYAGKGQSVTVTKDYDVTLAGTLDKRVVDPYLAPLMADENQLRKMPATFIVACEYEQLRDEIVLFADRLRSTGVSTDFRFLKGQTHVVLPVVGTPSMGFDNSDMEEVASNVAKFLVKTAEMD